MREIKVRIWDRDRKKMLYPGADFNTIPAVQQPLATKDGGLVCSFDVILCTNLKDKNGKEIYEGDVIEHVVFDRPYSSKRKAYTSRKIVEFFIDETKTVGGDPVNCIGIRGKTVKTFEDGCCDWSEFFRCQVIGNIYENPELLEQSAQISAQ